LCAARGSFADFIDRAGKIFLGVGGATHLDEADRKLIRHDCSLASRTSRGEPAINIRKAAGGALMKKKCA
jgi:hypothetical protein